MASTKSFSKKEAIRFGWETTKKNFWFLLGITLVSWGISLVPNILTLYLKDQDLFLGITRFIVYIIGLGISLGILKIYLSFVDGNKPKFSDLFSLFDPKLMFRYFIASTLFFLVVALGYILLIIPGVYFSIKYSYYSYLIVDKNAGVLESISKSGEITKGVIWQLILFGLVGVLILIVGFLALGIGLFVAIPTVGLASAYVYRILSAQASSQVVLPTQNQVTSA